MSLKILIKNLKFLYKTDIKQYVTNLSEDLFERIFDEIDLDFNRRISNVKIKSFEETIDDLILSNASIARFGDGEFFLMNGESIGFQKHSQRLEDSLKAVLSSELDNLFIGIPSFLYTNKNNLVKNSRNYWRMHGSKLRALIEQYIYPDKQYYSAEITIATEAFTDIDKEAYFNKIKQLWFQNDCTVVCAQSVLDKVEYNIFDCAKTLDYIIAPNINAFEKYDDILEKIKTVDKSRKIILMLGPTATILAYDLAKLGYCALDMGHIIKAYDWYRKNKSTLCIQECGEFFNPD